MTLPLIDTEAIRKATREFADQSRQTVFTMASSVKIPTVPDVDFEDMKESIRDLVDRSQQKYVAWSSTSVKVP